MSEQIIEAQKIDQSIRKTTLLNTITALNTGESLVIVNNHDPKQLFIHLSDLAPGQFKIEYIEEGPEEWKVRVKKKNKEGCCGCC